MHKNKLILTLFFIIVVFGSAKQGPGNFVYQDLLFFFCLRWDFNMKPHGSQPLHLPISIVIFQRKGVLLSLPAPSLRAKRSRFEL